MRAVPNQGQLGLHRRPRYCRARRSVCLQLHRARHCRSVDVRSGSPSARRCQAQVRLVESGRLSFAGFLRRRLLSATSILLSRCCCCVAVLQWGHRRREYSSSGISCTGHFPLVTYGPSDATFRPEGLNAHIRCFARSYPPSDFDASPAPGSFRLVEVRAVDAGDHYSPSRLRLWPAASLAEDVPRCTTRSGVMPDSVA